MNALRIPFPVTVLPAAAVVCGVALGLGLLFAPDPRMILVLALGIGAASALALLPHAVLFPFYLCYLMFEGAAKVWTNYHPVVHVGSDLILLVAFVRLFNRFLHSPPASPRHQSQIRVVTTFLGFYWMWVALQFLNPWGLGVLPSLAGMKIHVIPMLSFFAVAYFLKQDEVRILPKVVLLLGITQCVFAIADYSLGPAFIAGLNGNYGQITARFLQGNPYRPFGTTHLPGAPSLWVFHSLFAALLVFHGVRKKLFSHQKNWRNLLAFYLPLALTTLVACQVRIAFVRFLIVGSVGLLLAGRRTARFTLAALATLALYYTVVGTSAPAEHPYRERSTLDKRFGLAISRIQTLESSSAWQSARSDLLALKRLQQRAQSTLMGTGLSRTAASSRPWAGRIKNDRHFGPDWSFTDNVFLALFTEVGLGGLLAYLGMIVAILFALIRAGTYPARIAALYCGAIFLSGVASEGILYQPDASAFWAAVGIGLRFDETAGGLA